MEVRNSFSAGLILAGVIVAPVAATAQTMMLAPLPPPRPIDLAVARSADAAALDPDAALRSSVAARDGVERRQHAAVMPRVDRDVPMPRPVPAIIAPARP